jgi:hypothetical protein
MPTTSRSGPVSLVEALERLLPHCNHSAFEVAGWLDLRQREGKIRLLGDDDLVAPNANPSMLAVMARIPPDGRAALYVEVRRHPGREYQTWAFERESFEAHFPTPVNRGGRPRIYGSKEHEQVLVEAAVAIFEEGLPNPLSGDRLADMVSVRLGDRSPGHTTLKKILKPLYERLEAESGQSAVVRRR